MTGERILTIGYGSGDAAEIIPMQFVEGWQHAARKIAFDAAMADAADIAEQDYLALHESGDRAPLTQRAGVFRIDRVGTGQAGFDDRGIEYYTLDS